MPAGDPFTARRELLGKPPRLSLATLRPKKTYDCTTQLCLENRPILAASGPGTWATSKQASHLTIVVALLLLCLSAAVACSHICFLCLRHTLVLCRPGIRRIGERRDLTFRRVDTLGAKRQPVSTGKQQSSLKLATQRACSAVQRVR